MPSRPRPPRREAGAGAALRGNRVPPPSPRTDRLCRHRPDPPATLAAPTRPRRASARHSAASASMRGLRSAAARRPGRRGYDASVSARLSGAPRSRAPVRLGHVLRRAPSRAPAGPCRPHALPSRSSFSSPEPSPFLTLFLSRHPSPPPSRPHPRPHSLQRPVKGRGNFSPCAQPAPAENFPLLRPLTRLAESQGPSKSRRTHFRGKANAHGTGPSAMSRKGPR